MVTLFMGNWFNIYIDQSLIPGLTTTLLDGFLPGLVDKYGADVPMALGVMCDDYPRTNFQQDAFGATGDFLVNFDVLSVDETAVSLNFTDIETMLELTLENFLLTPKVDSVKINNVDAVYSTIGKINTFQIKSFLNLGISMALPIINKVLSKGIEFPHSFFNGSIVIQNATFNSYPNYLSIEFEPTFNWVST